MAINLSPYSLPEKAVIVAREIVKHINDPIMVRLAKELKTPENDLKWVKSHIRYKHEEGDILYEPETTIFHLGEADCEDLTQIIGILARIQGYPVRIRIIANGTRHIYPIIKINNRWQAFDATPHPGIVESSLGMPINRPYHKVIDGLVTDDLEAPLSGIKSSGFKDEFMEAVTTGAGIAMGSAIAKIIMSRVGVGALSGLSGYQKVDVPLSYQPEVGDHLLFYFKPKWYLPSILEKWLIKKVVTKRIPYSRILSANYKTTNEHKYLVVEVEVTGQESISGLALETRKTPWGVLGGKAPLGSITLAITIGLIAAGIIGGGLATYFSLDKVQKIVKTPQMASVMKIMPYALLLGAVALLLSELNRE